jgi:glycosyltransferase involved in cell wall biosynthesis
LVTSNDPAMLAAAINGLLVDEQRRRELGRRGPAAARHLFSWSTVVEEMESFYSSAIAHSVGTGVVVRT